MILKLILLLCLVPPLWAAENVKTIKLCENGVAPILISPKGTVLDFPGNPEKVVLGSKGSFSIEYIRDDLAVSPTSPASRANLFVYLQGRRFSLELATQPYAPTLYFVKDCPNQKTSGKKRGR